MNKTKVREWDDVVGGERLTKGEYQRILEQSEPNCRGWFMTCAHAIPLGFAGQIERVTKEKICFKRIYVSGMYPDGICFDGKEDHVWMDLKGFEEYSVGDSLEFFAEVYRYLKTSNGKLIDYGLRNPEGIKRVEEYELPSDDDLLRKEINLLICETCPLDEHCNRVNCIANRKEKKHLKKELFDLAKAGDEGRN